MYATRIKAPTRYRLLGSTLSLLGALLFLSCGGGSTPITITFDNGTPLSEDPFLDTDIVDVVFTLQSEAPAADVANASGTVVIEQGALLDDNADGTADTLVFPTSCNASLAPNGCGFARSASNFNIDGVPLNYRFKLRVGFRNNASNVVYSGSVSFNNIEGESTVTLVVKDGANN